MSDSDRCCWDDVDGNQGMPLAMDTGGGGCSKEEVRPNEELSLTTTVNSPCLSGGDSENSILVQVESVTEEASVPLSPAKDEVIRWNPSVQPQEKTHPSSNNNTPNSCSSSDVTIDMLENNLDKSHEVMGKVIPDKVLLDLNQLFPQQNSSPSMESSSEISKVLDSFNAILEDIELVEVGTDYDPASLRAALSDGEKEYIVNTMEAFSDLLIGGEGDSATNNYEKDLLIVVDDNSTDSDSESSCDDNNGPDMDCDNSKEDEVEILEEGYESDRPMVRSSMRKLRPVQMVPMPSTSSSSANSGSSFSNQNQLQVPVLPIVPAYCQGHTLLTPTSSNNPPVTNMLLVTSLMNNVLSSASEPPSLEDNNAIVLDMESSSHGPHEIPSHIQSPPSNSSTSQRLPLNSNHNYTSHTSAQFQVNSSSSYFNTSNGRSDPPGEGCATFRPAANLVFRNLHVSPLDLENGEPAGNQG